MENTIINNNAIISFRKIEDIYFNNLGIIGLLPLVASTAEKTDR